MKFDTQGIKRKNFRSDEEYLSAVYDRNRQAFEEHTVRGQIMSKDQFVNINLLYKKYGDNKHDKMTLKQTLSKIANSVTFTPYSQRSRENFIRKLKQFGGDDSTWRQFRELTKDEHGRYTKFDSEKMVWNSELKGFVYDNRLYIDISNSPVMITFSFI